MKSKFSPVLTLARRELHDQLQDWRIIVPMICLALFFPLLMNFVALRVVDFIHEYAQNIVAERLVPFFMMIVGFFPISISLVIALESFVGERERGSIEPLLASPLRDWQIYLGKMISSILIPLVASYLGMAVYFLGLVIQNVMLPEPELMLLIFILTTVQAVMMVAGAVVVSSQATSVRAANLLASVIIIPTALLIQAESMIIFWDSFQLLWVVLVGLAALTVLLARVGLAHFQREELLGREIDVLSIKWIGRVFWKEFSGGATNFWGWYRVAVPRSLRAMRLPLVITVVLASAALISGAIFIQQVQVPGAIFQPGNEEAKVQELLEQWQLFSVDPVLGIWWQNVRALLVGMALGSVSLGVLGMLPILGTMGVVGGVLGMLSAHGGSPLLYSIAFILPHGLIEIPAALLASAAVLKSGARLVTPSPGKTVGEVWITSLADWTKIMVGVVIPMLLVAAAVEAWITPRIALLIFGK